jgi:ATP-dependent DNA helicase PIF1
VFQVGGVTIHSLLSVGEIHNAKPLSEPVKRRLQQDLKNTRFLFVDEKSMVGPKMLSIIDRRLREIFPQHHDKQFCGISVILFGDFGQLPPVMDPALYAPMTARSPASIRRASTELYKSNFTKVFHLTEQMRQRGQEDGDLKLGTALANMRVGSITPDDWQFCQTRVLSKLSTAARQRFDSAIRLFTRNSEVQEMNTQKLEAIRAPVAKVTARYHGITEGEGCKLNSDMCGGLAHVVYLAVGARVSTTSVLGS